MSSETLGEKAAKDIPVFSTLISKYATLQELRAEIVRFWAKQYYRKLKLKYRAAIE